MNNHEFGRWVAPKSPEENQADNLVLDEANAKTLIIAKREAARTQREQRNPTHQWFNGEARYKDWNIFSPNWDLVNDCPALSVATLVALSVGLHSYFAVRSWVEAEAIGYFNGVARDIYLDAPVNAEDAQKEQQLKTFLMRLEVATNNLSPLGELSPLTTDTGDMARLKVVDFVAFAIQKGWSMPDELKDRLIIEPPLNEPKGLLTSTPHNKTNNTPTAAWLEIDLTDPHPKQPWYTPARYFARLWVSEDSALLNRKKALAEKVELSLRNHEIKGSRGNYVHAPTILKAFSNVIFTSNND